jgi:K+-sensing histidine kinase KdpD
MDKQTGRRNDLHFCNLEFLRRLFELCHFKPDCPFLDKCLFYRLLVDVPEHLPTVNIDAPRLEQVITNLLSNADKYNSPHGNIYLKARISEKELSIEVKDEGIGIPENEIGNIFKPYHRVQQNKHIPGLGLGLTVCKQIVEAHDGQIWVKSQPGNGSIFGFTVPAK